MIGSLVWAARTALEQPPRASPADYVPEFVVAAALTLLGLRSLRRWMRVRFEAGSVGEHLLYALHVTARVGVWFALAGFFVGYAVVDDPQKLGWFALVVIGLAGVQLLSAFYLSRSPGSTPGGRSP
jgi:hypothetical protein